MAMATPKMHTVIFSRRFLLDHSDRELPLSFESTPSSDARPIGVSFPLGTALVLIIVLSFSAIFSFCYHWARLRRRVPSSVFDTPVVSTAPEHCLPKLPSAKLQTVPSLPVVMPGDDMPKFIAWPCPYVDDLELMSKRKEVVEGMEIAVNTGAAMEPKPS